MTTAVPTTAEVDIAATEDDASARHAIPFTTASATTNTAAIKATAATTNTAVIRATVAIKDTAVIKGTAVIKNITAEAVPQQQSVRLLQDVRQATAVEVIAAEALAEVGHMVAAAPHSAEATAVEVVAAVPSAEAAVAATAEEDTAAAEAARSEDVVRMRTSAFIIR